MHTFPADGEYSFRMQLHSIPTGQLFGSTVKGELLEVSIDGERAAVLEINPRMSEADPNGMNIVTPRIHVKAGTHRLAAAFVQRFDAVPDDLLPPIDHSLADSQIGSGFGITTLPHLREFAVERPVQGHRHLGNAEPQAHLHLPADVGGRRSGVRERDHPQARDAGVSRPARARRTSTA